MNKVPVKTHLNFLIKSAFAMGLTLALADLLTNVLYGADSYDVVNSLKLIALAFGLGGLVVVILSPIFLLLAKLHLAIAKTLSYAICSVILIASILLNKYYATTHLSLGSDLYGYSIADIKMIVSTSTDVSLLSFSPVIAFILFYFGILRFLQVRNVPNIWLGILLVTTLAFGVVDSFSQKPSNTHLSFFLKDSIEYLSSINKTQKAGLPSNEPYPLMRDNINITDVLGKHLDLKPEKPNIVMILVEGLGRDFSGDDAEYPGFTPFLDSLSEVSLSWTNFMSNAGRSYGALPSILGSLPFGKNGFLDLENLPDHVSLISQLKNSNYKTFYFEGGDADFDHKLKYLNNEGMENIVDSHNYSQEYTKTVSDEGFSWGYPDSEIFRKALADSKPITQPRFDMILTISNHEPFIFENKTNYLNRVDNMLKQNNKYAPKSEIIGKYKDVFSAVLYTDDCIKSFIEKYKSRPDYENTIFIITGDHRLIPVPQKNEICRYHVPLIIYSPMLTKPEKFRGISSHMDIMPSILEMLNNKYAEKKLAKVPWIGTGLSESTTFTNTRSFPLSRYKGAIKDFVSGNFFLSEKTLYEIEDNLEIMESGNGKEQDKMREKLVAFQSINNYVTQNNKIIPPNLIAQSTNKKIFTKEQLLKIELLLKEKKDQDPFNVAREVAFNKQYDNALLLCDYILRDSPNHFDTRTLKGRIYAWNGKVELAETELNTVIERNPGYKDAYSAILDLYWWNDKPKQAREIAKKAIENINNDKVFQKDIKIAMDRFEKSI